MTHTLHIEPYFKLDSLFFRNGVYDTNISIDDVAEEFTKAVNHRIGDINQLGISLSGGLDSRAILAALKEKSMGIDSYTLDLHGCYDIKLSHQISKIANTNHKSIELDSQYLNDFKSMAETLIYQSAGLYHPHESTEKLALDYFKKTPL